jgi:hypothetical protein
MIAEKIKSSLVFLRMLSDARYHSLKEIVYEKCGDEGRWQHPDHKG